MGAGKIRRGKLSLATCDHTKNLTRVVTASASPPRAQKSTIFLASCATRLRAVPSCSFALICADEAEKAYPAAAQRFKSDVEEDQEHGPPLLVALNEVKV